ncbi:MAG: Flp family type IVb pilin [Sulfuriferula sp.]
MQRIRFFAWVLWRDESGVTAIEYALLASLIAMVILGAVVTLGNTILSLWNEVAGCVANPSSCL